MMLNKNHPILVDSFCINKLLKFHSTDSEENFLKQKKLLGKDWYYYDLPIDYNFNEWGYRTKNFSDLNGDYILVFGCSYTEGIGLRNEDVWVNRLGEKLGLDVFNLGKGGTGGIINFINTTLFYKYLIKNKLRLPKYVIYQWSFAHRISLVKNVGDELVFEGYTANSDFNPNLFNFFKEYYIMNDGETMKNIIILPLVCDNLWRGKDVVTLHWSWSNNENEINFGIKNKDPKMFYDDVVDIIPIIDKYGDIIARDQAHNGHLSHLFASNIIYDKINKK